MKKAVIGLCTFFCILMLGGSVSRAAGHPVDPTFFYDAKGAWYVCFTDRTSEDCVRFEAMLEQACEAAGWEAVYFDVTGAPQNANAAYVLERYPIETCPTVIRILDGEIRDRYVWDPGLSEAETLRQLEAYLIDQKTAPVTGQFSDVFCAFSFFLMLANLLYLVWGRKRLRQEGAEPKLIFVIVFTTVLMALHVSEAAFGFAYALRTGAGMVPGVLAQIGRNTWLTVTPVLYLVIFILCFRWGWCRPGRLEREKESMQSG